MFNLVRNWPSAIFKKSAWELFWVLVSAYIKVPHGAGGEKCEIIRTDGKLARE